MSAEFATGLAVIAAVMAFISMRRTKALKARLDDLEGFLLSGTELPIAPEAAVEPAEVPENAPDAETKGTIWGGGKAAKPPKEPSGPGVLTVFAGWLKANWIYPVAAVALVMAAVFLVQYSIEAGLLSPKMRIGLALLLGAALITVGEVIRRRWGGEDGPARIVPATLSGAGIFALLAAVLAAFHLYDMLSQPATLIALAGIALLAMVLGWVHGPMLAALGILSGTAAPFLLGEGSAPMDLLFAYFGAVALLGLGIDGQRRWGWISALAVSVPQAGAFMILQAGAGHQGMIALALLIPALSMAIPFGTLVPLAAGPTLWQDRTLRVNWVPALALAVASGILVVMDQAVVGVLALIGLALIHSVWTRSAPALSDLVLIPILAVPAAVVFTMLNAQQSLTGALNISPSITLIAVALAALTGAAMIVRCEAAEGGLRDFWTLMGVGLPMGTYVAFELFWTLSARIPALTWAITAMALAAGYVALALWAARRDAGQGLRLGSAVAAGFTMIALSLMVSLSLAALTAALAVLMVVGALMDRRFNLPVLSWFLVFSSMALGYRIVLSPGLSWLGGYDATGGATGFEVWISLGAALIGPALTLLLIRDLPVFKSRDWGRMFIETGLSGMIPIAIAIVAARFLADALQDHTISGIQGTVLMALAWVHAQRAAQSTGSVVMRRLRFGLSLIFAALSAFALLLGFILFSPLNSGGFLSIRVHGPPLVNDMIVAYVIPALLLLWITWNKAGKLGVIARLIGLAMLANWLGLVIRHLWHGGTGMGLRHGFEQGELYAYTVALLLSGGAALALALRLGRDSLRIVGLALIGVAAAKAFLIDASGLTGLLRVGAFLALGLSLVGMAWLNGWVASRIKGSTDV